MQTDAMQIVSKILNLFYFKLNRRLIVSLCNCLEIVNDTTSQGRGYLFLADQLFPKPGGQIVPTTLLLAPSPPDFWTFLRPWIICWNLVFSEIHEKKTFNRYRYHKSRAGGNRGMVGVKDIIVKDIIAPIDFRHI